MKAVLALTASISLASAALLPRQLDSIPQCALQCALGSLQSTGCQTTDFACICRASAFVSSLIPCVQAGCSETEIAATIQAASGLCEAAGVSLSVPPLGSQTSAATSAMETSSAPAATTSETEATTSAPSTEATSAPSSVAMTSSAETTEAPATTSAGGANGTVSTTSPPNPTGTEPGAASRNTVALGGLGAVVALIAAFL
ncbi:hypothetical protein TWF102_001411 [Orbilia oligospora]|uniref:CFEM domain-containing protein n=1 Tax=Orbilia oligospora TaxID=2813651 RepID=A0A7C8NFR4_ORBOL|nr:hypothetical protein TWF706_003726 [Orbilia oligospora]KAF3106460.1 hypothetical protein TWF102_001411 [Orbilia oligospora]KAF3106630.1 hypothetical protein TWF103_006121 [Orbilia oligospora]KAF3130710.1 hypothetical protein TWF594_010234 [Orbilia oligospora]KAF3140655.1 hypothetical protein TWF703_002861 [Orbilia oligospora]